MHIKDLAPRPIASTISLGQRAKNTQPPVVFLDEFAKWPADECGFKVTRDPTIPRNKLRFYDADGLLVEVVKIVAVGADSATEWTR